MSCDQKKIMDALDTLLQETEHMVMCMEGCTKLCDLCKRAGICQRCKLQNRFDGDLELSIMRMRIELSAFKRTLLSRLKVHESDCFFEEKES